MTNRIDRLETRGLVVREPVPDDRRGTWVALTDEGRSRVDGAFIDLLAEERDLLAVLPPRTSPTWPPACATCSCSSSPRRLPTPPRFDPTLGRRGAI